ncbi:MAG TPA: CPBP family glutamic-type intramembrane protease [Candidatus Acidoferrum sp.]|nr:CPBP family glutamic-type intramembrane protease [Candidatus Acidoferrum sp.]
MAEREQICAQHRRELSGSLYTVFFLLVTSFALDRAFSLYFDKLLRGGQISRWTYLLRYFHTGMAVVFLAELTLVICLYRFGPLRMTLRDMGMTIAAQKWGGLAWGFLAGILVCVAGLPLLRLDRRSDLTDLIMGEVFHPRIILLVILFAILLPLASEIVFRGIVFKSLLESSRLVPAVLVSALAFALVWPVYNLITGFLLGLTTAVLYHRFRSAIPAVVANAVFTVAYATTLLLRRLY